MAVRKSSPLTVSDELRAAKRYGRALMNCAELAEFAPTEYMRVHPDGVPMTDNRGNELYAPNTTGAYYAARLEPLTVAFLDPKTVNLA
jgi:hypothetical protein